MNGKSRPHSEPAELGQPAARRFLTSVLDRERTSIPKLAKKAGVTASTLYRILDQDDPFTTSMRTIERIERATGHSYAEAVTGFAEPEARFVSEEDAPAELKPGTGEGVWRIGSRVAELAGFLPGDLILFEIGAEPAPGDLVVANVEDRTGGFLPGDLILFEIGAEPAPGDLVVANVEDRTGGAETIIRVFDPPYLITRTYDAASAHKPVPVDGVSVRIMGRFKRMLRSRRVVPDNRRHA